LISTAHIPTVSLSHSDWAELMEIYSFELPMLPDTTNEYILSLENALEECYDVASIALPIKDIKETVLVIDTSCVLIVLLFRSFCRSRLYRKAAFLADLSESY